MDTIVYKHLPLTLTLSMHLMCNCIPGFGIAEGLSITVINHSTKKYVGAGWGNSCTAQIPTLHKFRKDLLCKISVLSVECSELVNLTHQVQ